MKAKRGRPPVDNPKRVRVSAYVSKNIAEIAIEQADSLNMSVSEYLGNILMAYISRFAPEDLNRGEDDEQ